jgi:hypothetical protein
MWESLYNKKLNSLDLSKIENTSNKLPVSIYDTIKKINEKIIEIKDNPDFQIKSSWLILDNDWKWCKGYCMWENEIPIICWKWELCNNFARATKQVKKINDFKNSEALKNIY